jgi:threonine dehydrogenase-like Zn-dependent dehydrogenase
MQALTFHDIGRVVHETVPDPALQARHDAIVRVTLTAVCGSDLHVYRGHERGLDPGTILGHEFVGEVVETGPDVRRLRRGQTVLSPFTTSCGACDACRRGLPSRCLHGALFGWVEAGQGLQGAQAEYVRVPRADTTLVPLPQSITPEEGLLLGDVFSTGFFCAKQGGVARGSSVVVLGAGPVGLMAVVGARELGAGQVLAVDSVPERLALAEGFGAEPVPLAPDLSQLLWERSGGHGYDVILEGVGSEAAHRTAVELVRPGGTISVVGVHTGSGFGFSPAQAYDKNLTYRVGRCPARAMIDELLPMAASKRHDIGRIVTHRMPLAEGPDAYRIFDARTDGCVKVVLEPAAMGEFL